MTRPGPHHIGTTGATDNQGLVYEKATDEVKYKTVVRSVVAGTNVTVDNTDPANPVVAASGGGGSLTVQDENANVSTAVTQIDFQGAGVTASAGTGEVVVTIPGGSASSLLAYKAYSGGTNTGRALTSLDDVDATNLAVTFTAPASGKVLVRLTAVLGGTGTQGLYWGLREGTTDLGSYLVRSSVTNENNSLAIPITGLTPGSSHTYKWAQRVGGASTTVTTYYGTSSTIAVMEVHALP